MRDRLREHWMLAVAAACGLLIALIGGGAYWLNVRHYESTDDAFIAARSFSLAPKVGGSRRIPVHKTLSKKVPVPCSARNRPNPISRHSRPTPRAPKPL
jgi:hypothetical protein